MEDAFNTNAGWELQSNMVDHNTESIHFGAI